MNPILYADWNGFLPVDVEYIAVQKKIKIEYSNIDCTAKYDHRNKILNINESNTLVRCRFFIARSIIANNHNISFKLSKTVTIGYKFKTIDDLALSLLIPAFAADHLIMKQKIRTIELLATKFQVSEIMMQRRLHILKYLK